MPPYKRIEVHTLSNDFRKATRIVEEPQRPRAHAGHVVVQNHYVGINATDINITNGAYTAQPPPFGCGLDAVGVIVEVGEGVTDFKVDEPVSYRKLGAFAEFVEVDASTLVKVPVPSPAVLPLIVCGTSASIALEHVGHMKSGETVFVTAAAGGTGQFVVQLAKLAGNHVIGTCSSDDKVEFLKNLGCDRVINYKKEDVTSVLKSEYPEGLNLVFESVGGELLRAAVDNIAPHGRIIAFGHISGYQSSGGSSDSDHHHHPYLVSELVPKLLFKAASLRGFISGNFRQHFVPHMDRLMALINEKKLVAGVDPATFSGLEQIPEALDYMYARKNIGKIVVKLADSDRSHCHNDDDGHDHDEWEVQFEKAMCKAARCGQLRAMQWLELHYRPAEDAVDVRGAMNEAVHHRGDLDIIRWLDHHYPDDLCDPHSLERAAANGYTHVLQWFLEHRRWEWSAMVGFLNPLSAAVANGQLETVVWLHTVAKRHLFTSSLMASAAENGHVHVMEWLQAQSNSSSGSSSSSSSSNSSWLSAAMDNAAKNGHLHVLQWLDLHYRDHACATTQAMDLAAANGHLHVVQWLHHRTRSEGCTTQAMDGAAANGHIAVVQWLHANRTEGCTLRSVVGAASRGDLPMLHWLHQNRHPEELLMGTAEVNPRNRAQHPVLATDALDNAAAGGFLDVVQWLHANRPQDRCTTRAMDQAAANGHLKVVQWLHEHRSEGCTTEAMDGAASHGHLEIVQWLHDNRNEGCTTNAMDSAAREGHLEVVQWLHRHRSEGCTTDAMDDSAIRGHLRVFQFLHENRREGCTVKAATRAAMKGRLDVLAFIFHNHRDAIDLVEVHGVSRSCSRLDILKWLHDVAMRSAAAVASVPV